MSFLGMGTVEIVIVLLIAFIFLGPERMVDVARTLGKWVAEVRRMAADLPDITLDENDRSAASPIIRRSTEPQTPPEGTPEPEELPDEDDGPVAHQRVNRPKINTEDETAAPRQESRANE